MLPKVPISCGELIDKITILELKSESFTNQRQLYNVKKELELLLAVDVDVPPHLRAMLKLCNLRLWFLEEEIRKEPSVETLLKIHEYNDRRAWIKRRIDKITGSEILEEKNYAP